MNIADQIVVNFSRHSSTYDSHAQAQGEAAFMLGQMLQNSSYQLPTGQVLEVGCGTGILTRELLAVFADRQLVVTDPSPEMLRQCQKKFEGKKDASYTSFHCAKVEELQGCSKYALIASSFVLQWALDVNIVLAKMVDLLLPGGLLAFCVPVVDSFVEWKDACRRANVHFSGNELPKANEVEAALMALGADHQVTKHQITAHYHSSLDFFKALKKVGAGTLIRQSKNKSIDLLRLIRVWDASVAGNISVTYDLLFAILKRA